MTSSDIRVAAVCTLVLYVKLVAALLAQGGSKFKSGARAPEDVAYVNRKQTPEEQALFIPPEALEAAKEVENRWNRIVGNDLENIPIGIVVAWVSIAAGGNSTATSALFILFTVCRIVHTLAFANGVFLPRTLAWTVGVLSTLGLAINAVVGAF
ncbi:unnamed protein product [Aphanomyces euteiches]|uniref:Microsomal glutathione S-transferase 1 n=1 Tax=Aphanomyces euteiches TaxID=100861 RepID=A0A6G0WM80_9STRA|nr:hypothetical protein Ae201684_013773 [Aphanomyces euteiches]KAH9080990.1 hypothetical protein Ae201684P_008076 [Aphanomyces euteiches]KAH9114891.1 hypothetical protein AeMF1_011054 [Aphanomyces euteiches]KAH9134553.1 hypothetical protein LEN26_006759 [Aphanomyces euteiches]KAH9145470.1 hypothetical protein AeRB84_010601 [Aphanomyces euteiches]